MLLAAHRIDQKEENHPHLQFPTDCKQGESSIRGIKHREEAGTNEHERRHGNDRFQQQIAPADYTDGHSYNSHDTCHQQGTSEGKPHLVTAREDDLDKERQREPGAEQQKIMFLSDQ